MIKEGLIVKKIGLGLIRNYECHLKVWETYIEFCRIKDGLKEQCEVIELTHIDVAVDPSDFQLTLTITPTN